MFPSNNSERTTGRTRPAKVRALRRGVYAAAGLVYLVCRVTPLASAAFERGAFSKIDFSDACVQKQWTLAPDNSLELLMAPPSHGVCEAFLEFYFPQDTQDLSTLAFEARSTRPGPFLKIGIQESLDTPRVVFSPSFPPEGLGTQWTEDGARLAHLQPGGAPAHIASLHFVVISNKSAPLRRHDIVMIRNIHFAGTAAAAPQKAALTPAVSAPPSAAPSRVHRFRAAPPPLAASARAFKFPLTQLRSAARSAARKLPLPLAAIGLVALVTSSKNRRKRILSPMYELNVRTWKTHRDANDVVQFGGFKKITLSDLKAVKQAGFNALWLMGIWEVGAKVRHISKNYAADFHGSPFAIYDYSVSSDLGTDQDFRELVQRAHSLRLSVMVDFIPNHMGLDSAWLNAHPEFFIHQALDASEADLPEEELKQRYPSHFPYRTPSYPQGNRRVPKTIMVAYGKDPYFYPWIDTAQLDFANPGLRQKMIDVLCHWASVVDGVRCDMAMLALREQVKIHRHPDMTWESFNQLMPHEFWTEAIQAAKRINPHFVFLAETYWSMEGTLQNVGFDYTYNKPLYEAICSALHSGHAEGLMNFLRLLGTDFLQRSVHFLENHDEERAMNALGEERQRAAAAILCTLPGIALLHQGQMEGKRERLPVQRVIPLHQEPEHHSLYHFYRRLLKATSLPVLQEGRLNPLYSNNPALVSYARLNSDGKVLVIVNTSHKKQKGSVFLMPGLRLHSGTPYRLNDLFYSFKSNTVGTVQPFYVYPGSKLINQGLYVELDPFDAHIFVIEAQGAMQSTQKVVSTIRQTLEEWPLSRVARRFSGAAFTRSSDTNLAANPTGRQS